MLLASWNPCPEHALNAITLGNDGGRSSMKCPSGVFVYMQAAESTSCHDAPLHHDSDLTTAALEPDHSLIEANVCATL